MYSIPFHANISLLFSLYLSYSFCNAKSNWMKCYFEKLKSIFVSYCQTMSIVNMSYQQRHSNSVLPSYFQVFSVCFIRNRELYNIKSVNRSYLTSHWLYCISISKIFSSIDIAVTNSKYETFFCVSSHDKDIAQKTTKLLLSLFLQFLFSEIIFICMIIVF